MGNITTPPPVKLIIAAMFRPEFEIASLIQQLEELFSPTDSRTEPFEFNFTDYYEMEMGKNLKKQFFSFESLIESERLPGIKLQTNGLENRDKQDGNRAVNIDPGYICAAKLVLATTKDFDHRLYLGQGIFGDVHLRFRKGAFRVNDWTYPDYRQLEILKFFEKVRASYLSQLGSGTRE